ncbi:Ssu72-like protein [Oesophagostomum dentatum]|uniref:RNA polymerase II subunit A C-terminal domain phosphatase SSU72 n=1 Tax=Oesophagostomum dentatum TaxID=61180 RepID=A0A0B1T1X4_OESDE|nr:Ssu72-like protein [Oesophagostomum dentatum]
MRAGEKRRILVEDDDIGEDYSPISSFLLRKRGFNIESYGSGNQVKLPGTAADKPNCYEFGKTTYEFIYNDLKAKDST